MTIKRYEDYKELEAENKRLRDALREIEEHPDEAYEIAEKILRVGHKTLRDEILDHKDAADQPDITITCRSVYGEETMQDVVKAMDTLIPTKYKFVEHGYKDGTHVLTYRRA